MVPLTYVPANQTAQIPFDAAVVIPTILRPSLLRAVRSVYAQQFGGRAQVLIGIDQAGGDPEILRTLAAECPSWCAVTVLHLGYSTSTRHGGLYPGATGGALRTILSYAANSQWIAYLDDDNWWDSNHLRSLRDAIVGKDWAFSLRWFVDEATLQPLSIDYWESRGPDAGVFGTRFGGFVDPNCLMLDKLACEDALSAWCYPVPDDSDSMTTDRSVFACLRGRPYGATGKPTSFYVMQPSDINHTVRLQLIGTLQAEQKQTGR